MKKIYIWEVIQWRRNKITEKKCLQLKKVKAKVKKTLLNINTYALIRMYKNYANMPS